MVIRDGLSTDKKFLLSTSVRHDNVYVEGDLFFSVVSAYNLYKKTQSLEGYKHIQTPDGFYLALTAFGADVDVAGGAEYPTLTSKQVLLKSIEEIIDKLTVEEKEYLREMDNIQFKPPIEDILREYCKNRYIDISECIDTWRLQPDLEAISYAITSNRATQEGITPVIGKPVNLCAPVSNLSKRRFPGIMTKYHENRVQIHKDGDFFITYDSAGHELTNFPPEKAISHLKEAGMSYVISGFNEDGEFIVDDVLCWNDIWLFRRPLSERLQLLWHFYDFMEEMLVVRNEDEYEVAHKELGSVLFRNLNSPFDPASIDNSVKVVEADTPMILEITGKRGGKQNSYLATGDKRIVFKAPKIVTKEERGKLVEVSKDGVILQIFEEGDEINYWSDLANEWGMPLDYSEYKRVPLSKWAVKEEEKKSLTDLVELMKDD